MDTPSMNIEASAPGRICLFGEHQDYLNLPVIASAISLRICIKGCYRNDSSIRIMLPDINAGEHFSLSGSISYTRERDYFRSTVNILKRHDFTFSRGFDCQVKGEIPINAGTSSSSALVVAWVNFLARMSDQAVQLPPRTIAQYAYEAEVLEFSEPGGMMDQYSTAIGNIIYLESCPELRIKSLKPNLSTFVLGNSMEPKDTTAILSNVKNQMLHIADMLAQKDPAFSLSTVSPEALDMYRKYLTPSQAALLEGNVRNYQITRAAKSLLETTPLDQKTFGNLLNAHQDILRDKLQISTPKIDRMIDAALQAGAYGCKINGSGGGGCMFAYAPEAPEKVLAAIEAVGGKGYLVDVHHGTQVDHV